MEVVLVYCKGRVDHIVPEAIRIAVERLEIAESVALKVLLLEVVANALFYNPAMTLSYLESKGWTHKIFSLFLEMLPTKFSRYIRNPHPSYFLDSMT